MGCLRANRGDRKGPVSRWPGSDSEPPAASCGCSRKRLLGFLPLAAAAAALVLPRRDVTVQTLAISVFGLVVTIGLVTYNARNDQLYDELVGRAASIERNLSATPAP